MTPPLISYPSYGGGATGLIMGSAAAAGPGPDGCTNYWDFTQSHNDLVGDPARNIDVNTGNLKLAGDHSSGYGGPPGFTDAGLIPSDNTGDTMPKTSSNSIMDFSGDFTWDVCSYNPHAVTSNQNIVASVSRTGSASPAWYIYNYQGSPRWDSANQGFTARLTGGEAAMTSNYQEDKWCVSRLQREGGTVRSNWYYADGTTWTVQGSVHTKTGVSGTGPKGNANGNSDKHGQMYVGGWGQANNTTYSVTNLGIAWMAFFAGDGTISGEPYKNENA